MRTLVNLSLILALVVIVLGAYTRLTDAGLGCPDWPGCYGHLSVPMDVDKAAAAQALFPDSPLEHEKAWNEMIHRYAAGTLGLFILFIAISALVKARKHAETPVKLPLFLLALVIFQAALGMWTVTLNLQPLVVMGHLLGGFSTLALLYLLRLRLKRIHLPMGDAKMRPLASFALFALLVVVAQIALGGWVAANYAALACTDLPICEGDWQSQLDVAGAFSVPEAVTYQYGAHDYAERMTMHVAHRIGAIITLIVVGILLWRGFNRAQSAVIRSSLNWVGLALVVQIALGLSNVIFMLPLSVAVAHNLVGALLLLSLVGLNYKIVRHA
ncbi:COX15/CtaA family protein [Pseudidiomarina terrestris]|uniref:COX15/CtaA family protein n=1 Tax=Pseudidiomarina terrestris TaxID=2820060 RepID=A0AAW7QZC1_9GAMM|nr:MULTISPECIES: COX15/CtaA family protein [unclassified Pseudidiomarina]MDN7125570.1 COX15/CtaA family protein [Pseudidiomarina sp. 1APP75-32.1]MDN7126183.1 COX15/CtaA family protein [Pseudidiomarina sp. 1APR75-33.1]MDN7130567.1 COX15/CtaA family protein [Pseudidiomarina sp. 1APR75-15]MDN7134208.1 COX15/CtaA family protein [Pseudidiomarina sp. 1ASP75-5]MDN7137104.1 COX15/CtaA family protein [Pseudidiomarina sp. 1ASP75-14]